MNSKHQTAKLPFDELCPHAVPLQPSSSRPDLHRSDEEPQHNRPLAPSISRDWETGTQSRLAPVQEVTTHLWPSLSTTGSHEPAHRSIGSSNTPQQHLEEDRSTVKGENFCFCSNTCLDFILFDNGPNEIVNGVSLYNGPKYCVGIQLLITC